MAEERLNIYQKLAKIRDVADVVQKSKKGFNYSYADIADILSKVRGGMKKYGVSLIPSFVHGTEDVSQNVIVKTKVSKTGSSYDEKNTEMLVKSQITYRWVNDENPNDFVDVPWLLVGSQGDVSQALGSGLTYTTRQFLTNYFQIAQDNDVDTYRSKQKEAEAAEDISIANAITGDIDVIVKSFVADNPDKRDEMIAFVKRYEKSGNYFNIKEPKLAASLLENIKKQFIKEEE